MFQHHELPSPSKPRIALSEISVSLELLELGLSARPEAEFGDEGHRPAVQAQGHVTGAGGVLALELGGGVEEPAAVPAQGGRVAVLGQLSDGGQGAGAP